jgi:hypothetical protein
VLSWLVINDPDEVHRIAGMAIDWMKAIKEANPALDEDVKMDLFVLPWRPVRTVFAGERSAS